MCRTFLIISQLIDEAIVVGRRARSHSIESRVVLLVEWIEAFTFAVAHLDDQLIQAANGS